jgi:hypothetical protein
MAMTELDELRITIDDALGLARRIEGANETREVSLVIVKLEEAFMWAERIGAPRTSPTPSATARSTPGIASSPKSASLLRPSLEAR